MESITYSSLLPLSLLFSVDSFMRQQWEREIFLLFPCLTLRQREEKISLDGISFFSILQMFLSPARREAELLAKGERGVLQMAKNPSPVHVEGNPSTASTHPNQPISWLSENPTDAERWWHVSPRALRPRCHHHSCQHITISYPSTQELEGASHCLPAQLRGAVLTAPIHRTAPSSTRQAGSLQTYRLATGSISAIGTGLMKCQSAALPIDPCSSVLQMSYSLCILPEMIKRRKQPPVLPGSPEGDTLLGREREAQFKGSRWQRGFELGAHCRNWEKVPEDFPSCSSAWFNLQQKINHR